MACGCGGTNGGSGGCGGDKPLANPLLETELAHELPQAAASAVVEFDPAPAAPGADAEPLLIASSEQDWPRIRVNGVLIEPEAMALELQYHPAAEQSEAMFLAAQALVIRELLQQRCSELSVQVEAGIGESQEEAAIRSLIELEVPVPEADESVCEHFYASNLPRFVSAPLLAARHILLECAPDDIEARISKREQADALLVQLQADPQRFTELALAHSACPSKEQGGALGQLSKGQTVPEFERQLFRQPQGLVSQPLESRYGFHVVYVDQRIEGLQLPYEAVAQDIRRELYQRVWQKSVAQYLQTLVGAADIQGIQLAGADSPLLQ
ncbi:MAG: peptidyl-prolyl cis-trans isomerase [Pseudomonadaceae bacterium]|jgi:peptidyl-prolyl cis-trans isomerase C|uniref:peptidylprolyl isomerase n=1 Tax=Pseudomonas sp. TaxID=306 RepID=UPI001B7746E5|nr:peptidylprolyl isomerase [Pseudomonas sp.]MBX9712695.1 peptidyl-prolyl cis-trans isomerase [Pseudomonadaceae bacterium]